MRQGAGVFSSTRFPRRRLPEARSSSGARRRARGVPRLLLTYNGLAAGACGGGGSGGGGGSPTGPSGTPGPSGATITIANGAVSPEEVTVNVGQSVTFANNDGRARAMMSDPHPTHTDCPAINVVGNLQPGQSRLTNSFTIARTCGYHDHNDPDSASVRGRIIVR